MVERILTQLVDIAAGPNSVLLSAAEHRRPTGYRDSLELVGRVGIIPADLAERLAPPAGLRNILTHEYGAVDLDQVARAVPIALDGYGRYVEQVSAYLKSHSAG